MTLDQVLISQILPQKHKEMQIRITFFFLINLFIFIYLFLAVLGLCFCARAFSSCGKRGPLFIAVRGPLAVVASFVAEHRLQMCRLSSCGYRPSCSVARGILPDQGPNPHPLHWQADPQPLRHQGNPRITFDEIPLHTHQDS